MPELPEVSLTADFLRPLLVNKQITQVEISPNSRYAHQPISGLNDFIQTNPTILDIKNHGKFMYWVCSNDQYLMCTFGMTGQWSTNKGLHPCIAVHLSTEPICIYFNDPRHFGTIKFGSLSQLNKKLKTLGWDALHQPWEIYQVKIISQIQKSSKPIGQLLLDQGLFAGVGNYIRAEVLYQVKISPWRLGSQLSSQEINQIAQACCQISQQSYQHQGATLLTYQTSLGEEGKYASLFQIYRKKQDSLGNPVITEITPEGRTIHWCPSIQK